jgi:O-antigen chain-terminating methyltransferase
MKEAAAHQGHLPDVASSQVLTSAEFRPARQTGPLAGIDVQPIVMQPKFQPRSDGRYHVNDLLKYHDRNFIQNAYRAILKRGPDATGYNAFIESLRSAGLNKIDILARLRYSAEGRAKKVEVEGLVVPAVIRKAYRVPFVGYLLNLAVAIARLPLSIRNEQQVEAHVLAQQEMIAEHLNHIGRTLRAHAKEVAQVLEEQFESIRNRDEHARQRIDRAQQQIDQVGQRLDRGIEQTQRQLELLDHQQLMHVTEQTKQAGVRLEQLAGEFETRAALLSNRLEARLNDETAERQQELWALGKRVGEVTSQGQEEARALEMRLEQGREEIRALETGFHQASAAQREHTRLTSRQLKREIDRVFQKQQQVSTELVLQSQRLARLLDEARQRLPAPFDEAQLRAIAGEADHTLDAFYASFDEQFRGTRAEIKGRMKVYLPLLKQKGIGSPEMPLLDVGCGRGEWLELLQQEQLQASGVDSNRVLVGQCAERGLDVVAEDLLSYMKRLADASLGAVTGFHIIEHLAIETLIEFLDQTVRVVKAGGVVIFETPNPQNVLVGSCNFYFDPTHRNPLPSPVMKFLLESRGFVGVDVLNLNPSDDTPVAADSELARRFNQYFYGPMDYAVVGYRP